MINFLLVVSNSYCAHKMSYILTPNDVRVTSIEMMHVPPGLSVTAADQEITFHPDGHRAAPRQPMHMAMPPSMLTWHGSGANVQQGYIVPAAGPGAEGAQAQATTQQQQMLQPRLTVQPRLMGQGARGGGEGGQGFNLDGTIADIPRATAVLQSAQYGEK